LEDGVHPFLGLFFSKDIVPYVPALTLRLVHGFESRNDEDLNEYIGTKSSSLAAWMTSVVKIFLLPFQLFQMLFPSKYGHRTLSECSLALLLILSYQVANVYHPLGLRSNPYKDTLSTVSNSDSVAVSLSETLSLSFQRLYDVLISTVDGEGLMLLFLLLQSNSLFKNYILAKSDIELLLMPLISSIYSLQNKDAQQTNIGVLVLLIISGDTNISYYLHDRIEIPYVHWYKEAILYKISLGSLIMLILLRKLQTNFAHSKDLFLHSNLLACLSNLSGNASHVHAHTSQKLISLLSYCSRKFVSLSGGHQDDHGSPQLDLDVNGDGHPEDLSTFGDFIRVLLDVVHACLVERLIETNLDLIYCLVHDLQLLEPLSTNETYWDVVSNLSKISAFFGQFAAQADQPGVSIHDIKKLMKANMKVFRQTVCSGLRDIPHSYYAYEETADASNYFLPFIWELAIRNCEIYFRSAGIELVEVESVRFCVQVFLIFVLEELY